MNYKKLFPRFGSSLLFLWLVSASAQSPELSIGFNSGAAKIGITGAVGRDYLLESISTFSFSNSWVPLAFISLTNSLQVWLDSASSTQRQRFYRAVEAGATAASVTLAMTNVALTPGNKANLTWEITGYTTNLQFLVRVREPGTVYTSTGSSSLHPGTRPATGRVFYLQSNQSWSTNEILYPGTNASASLQVGLPNNQTGEWRFELLLRNSASGEIVAASSRSLLVSSAPTLLLRLNRPIANTTDRITVELTTAAGATNRMIKIAALLTLPDGTQVSLPLFNPGLEFLYDGMSTNQQFTLLDRVMSDFGSGAFRIRVRLIAGDTGKLLDMADASFQVCDKLSAVKGIVFAANGQPLGSGNPSLTTVSALDVDDGSITAVAAIDSSGNYTLNLAPGRYFLSAEVIDSTGYHAVNRTNLLIIGCTGTNVTLMVTAAPPSTMTFAAPQLTRSLQIDKSLFSTTPALRIVSATSQHVSMQSPNSPASGPNASDGLPKPGVMIFTSFQGLTSEEQAGAQTFSREFKNWVTTAAGYEVEFITTAEVNAMLTQSATNPLLNGDGPGNLLDNEQLRHATGKEFIIQLTFLSDQFGKSVTAEVIDSKTRGIVRAHQERGSPITGGMVLETASRIGIDLFQELRANQLRPIVPILAIDVTPQSLLRDGSISVTGTLKEKTGQLMANKPIAIFNERPSGAEEVTLAETDTDGVFRATLAAGNQSGDGSVYALHRHVSYKSRVAHYYVEQESDLSIISSVASLKAGESARMYAKVRFAGAPVSAARVELGVVGGTLDVPRTTTAVDGLGDFRFFAGNASGIATVNATYIDMSSGSPVTRTAVRSITIDGGVAANLNSTLTNVIDNGTSDVVTDVQVGDARVPALPVQFSLQGEGTLSVVASQTDENGQAIITYLAPTNGTGSSVITAIATVDDQSYTNTLTIHYEPACGPDMVSISAGTFTIGSPDSELCRARSEGPQTRVTITRGFCMGKYEVTQGEYLAVMGSNPSSFTGDLNRPVERVSWNDAVAYCAALTTRERNAGRLPAGSEYRLPTSAEWEYACRAGTTTAFHYGDALRSGMANFIGSDEYPGCGGPAFCTCYNPSGIVLDRTTAVGSYAPNAWGLYDMHGNVGEWCQDWFSDGYPGGSVTDPQGPATGSYRVFRGGGWIDSASSCRSAFRPFSDPAGRIYVGFRVVLAPVRP